MEISQKESDRRRRSVDATTRLVQSEGLPITARMRQVDQRYISGEIDWTEYNRIQREWRPGIGEESMEINQ